VSPGRVIELETLSTYIEIHLEEIFVTESAISFLKGRVYHLVSYIPQFSMTGRTISRIIGIYIMASLTYPKGELRFMKLIELIFPTVVSRWERDDPEGIFFY